MRENASDSLVDADELHEPCDGGLAVIMKFCPARCLHLTILLLDQIEARKIVLNLCTQLLPKRFCHCQLRGALKASNWILGNAEEATGFLTSRSRVADNMRPDGWQRLSSSA